MENQLETRKLKNLKYKNKYIHTNIHICNFVTMCVVPGMEPTALHRLGQHSTLNYIPGP